MRLNPKWLLLVLYAVLASVAISYRAELLVWIKSGGAAQNWLALAVVTFLALVPVVPYGVIGAAIGAA
ncbi:MAG: TVP38/TMEM64 family protein, partial [Tumebacillaceae bacterium]